MPTISALGSLREEDHKFKTSLGYIIRYCLKEQKKKKKKDTLTFSFVYHYPSH